METTLLEQTIERYEVLYPKIRAIKNHRTQMDLLKFAKTCATLRAEISKELVECRRRHHPSVKYQELLDKLSQSVSTLEEYTTFALLLDT
jgi:hypothetical protein